MLGGKEYWISIFNKKSQKGEQYLSGVVEPKKPKTEEKLVDPGWETPPEEPTPFNDTIPF